MAKRTLTITFNNPINVSVQVGDIVYYLNSGTVVELGKLLTISGKTITCEIDQNQANPSNNSFILFSKDSINAIYNWVNKNIIDLPIDMLLMKLIKERVITGWEVKENISTNPMFYGLFEQFGTYCTNRQNNTIENYIRFFTD